MVKAVDTVLFDLDGTLTDPAEGITNSVAYALERYGITVTDRSELNKFIGPPLVGSFMEYYGFSEDDAKNAVSVYREYFSEKGLFENKVYAGIPEMLSELKSNGKKLILATSKPEVFAIRILEHFDLLKYFDFTAGSLLDHRRVDKSEVIEYALASAGIDDRNSTVMVGDRKHDMIGGKTAGIGTVGVLWGYGTIDELTESRADIIVSTIDGLTKTILNKAKWRLL